MPLKRPTTARFTVAGTAAPLTAALPLAERIHLALVSLSDGAPVFTGCDSEGKPLQGHGHAHILCECCPGEQEQGEITHVTVYAHMGFGPREQAALHGLNRVWGPDGPGVELALQGLGRPEDFAGKSSLLAKSRSWVSRTPFLPTRHPKRTRAGVAKRDGTGLQMGSPEHDLLRLLEQAGLPRPVMVEKVAGTMLGGREMRWESFQCRRREGGGRRAGESSGFRILFPEAVQGPVAVGYASHFGMGGFVGDGPKCIDL